MGLVNSILDNPGGARAFKERVSSIACFKGFKSRAWRFRLSLSLLFRAELGPPA